uniref:Uncharacterized protein LOC105133002 n=2 Tax=Rhizophora mucronata TaxID=61149 RepID=A0A2P2LTI0_RHIMU
MPNWELKNCCKHDQAVFLIAIAVYSLVILLLWRTFLMTPFKLIAVFLHETSHAVACKLTCGQVEGMQVHANEGGVTLTRGGVYWLILPAGCNSLPPLIFFPCFATYVLGLLMGQERVALSCLYMLIYL